jgi:hypothetical protein
MKCPICETKLHFGEEMMLWDTQYGEDCDLNAPGPVSVNIYCAFCELGVGTVTIQAGGINLSKKTQAIIVEKIKKLEKEKN